MKTYVGVYVYICVFLTSALVGDWSASRPGRFTPGERAPSTHWTGGWVGPRTGLNDVKRKLLTLPRLELRPHGRPAHSQSLYRLGYLGWKQMCEKRGQEPWNPEVVDIVGIRFQATPSKDIEDLVCAAVRSNMCESAIAL
jgi:hypothetical protein